MTDTDGDPRLREGYRRCAAVTRAHGTTYYWGTRLLRPEQRRDVFAVYTLCRIADDIVDHPVGGIEETAANLLNFRHRFFSALTDGDEDPVLSAVASTVRGRRIPTECFDRFFDAMALDLHRSTWASWEDLRDGYMEGSAAVIGEMMLPVLEPRHPAAIGPARALGLAFQLTNFIRDVGEDLDRGRVYLPADELSRYGADPWLRQVTPQWRAFCAAQIARNRRLYDEARPGVTMLPGGSARCVATALRMYADILARIEAADYDVFATRRRVPRRRKAVLLADVLVRGPRTASAERSR